MAAPTVLSLCSGYGGLEIAVRDVYPRARVVGYVEWEPYSAAVLLARMEDASLEPAPIWCDDLAELPAAPFLGVDLITAGFNCQPWSAAGKGLGTEDERWIWPDIIDLADRVGCRTLFLENVPPLIVRGGLDLVLADLAARGFDAEWTCLRASSVGATHQRERVFILAHRNGGGWGPNLGGDDEGQPDTPRGRSIALADTSGAGRPEVAGGPSSDEGGHAWWPEVAGDFPDGPLQDVADRYSERLARVRSGGLHNGDGAARGDDAHRRSRSTLADRYRARWEVWARAFGRRAPLPGPRYDGDALVDSTSQREREPHDEGGTESRERPRPSISGGRGVFPPGPDDRDAWDREPPGAQPSLRRGADGSAYWLGTAHASVDDQLRTLGNGVVWQQAAAALRILSERLT